MGEIMGVTRTAPHRFRARYSVNGVRYNVGTFKRKAQAEEAMAKHMWNNKHYPGFIDIPMQKNITIPRPTVIERFKSAINNIRANAKQKK